VKTGTSLFDHLHSASIPTYAGMTTLGGFIKLFLNPSLCSFLKSVQTRDRNEKYSSLIFQTKSLIFQY